MNLNKINTQKEGIKMRNLTIEKALELVSTGVEWRSKTTGIVQSGSLGLSKLGAVDYLNAHGYNCGTADGIAGIKFDLAVKTYQKANGCIADGELTKEGKTWKCILGML